MNNRIIFISSAYKDSGRSILATLLVEHGVTHGYPMVVIEPSWRRPSLSLQLHDDVRHHSIPLHDHGRIAKDIELGMARLLAILRDSNRPIVIIKLPAAHMMEVQARIYQHLASVRAELKLDLVAAFVMGPDHVSTSVLEAVWLEESFHGCDERFILPNAIYGRTSYFHWKTSACHRKNMYRCAGEFVLPEMPEVSEKLRQDFMGTMQNTTPEPGAMPACRRGFLLWLAKGAVLADRLLFGPHPPKKPVDEDDSIIPAMTSALAAIPQDMPHGPPTGTDGTIPPS